MRAEPVLYFTTAESWAKILLIKLIEAQVSLATVPSKAVVLLLFIHCLLFFRLFVRFCGWSLF